jgi:RNA polymerase sigma factor (sigma-70 family)
VGLDIAALYEKYGPMVLRRCRRLLRDEAQAADAMHDVFVRLLKSNRRLTGQAVSSLLYVTATNECLSRLRGRRRAPIDAEDALVLEVAEVDDLEGRTVSRALLETAFALEPVSTRTIAVLYHLDEMTHAQVAAEVGLSVSGVRKRLRALEGRVSSLGGAA